MIKVVFCDPHIREDCLEELEQIFTEICRTKGDILFMCGDYYDRNNPTAKELDFGTKWAYFFKKLFDKVIFIKGNHDKDRDVSTIDYLKYFGIEIVNEYIDESNIYYGHFMTDKSKCEYGKPEKTVEQLKQYKYVILGHYHSWQEIAPRMVHPGSVRWVGFNEVKDKNKYYMLEFHNAGWDRKIISSAIPMKDFKSINELNNQKNTNIKARLVISSYKQFKNEINDIEDFKNKFKEFKLKLDIKDKMIVPENIEINKKKKIEDIIKEGISQIEDKDVKKLLEDNIK